MALLLLFIGWARCAWFFFKQWACFTLGIRKKKKDRQDYSEGWREVENWKDDQHCLGSPCIFWFKVFPHQHQHHALSSNELPFPTQQILGLWGGQLSHRDHCPCLNNQVTASMMNELAFVLAWTKSLSPFFCCPTTVLILALICLCSSTLFWLSSLLCFRRVFLNIFFRFKIL